MISTNLWAGNSGASDLIFKISPDLNFSPASGYKKCWEIAYGEVSAPVHVFVKETKKGQG